MKTLKSVTAQLPTETVVQLLLINMQRYYVECLAQKEKPRSGRIRNSRLSKAMLRYVSGHRVLSQDYLKELEIMFRQYGWHFFENSDTEFALVLLDATSNWKKA